MKSKKVFLQFYSRKNLGDDLFAYIIAQRYADSFVAISKGGNPELSRLSNLKIHRLNPLMRMLDVFGKVIGIKNVPQLLYMNGCHLMVYVGGSIFIEGESIRAWVLERAFYLRLRVPFYVLGSNIGPYKSKEFLPIVRDIASLSKDFCLRDQSSYQLMKSVDGKVRLATDIAFTLDATVYQEPGFYEKDRETAIVSVIDGYKKFPPDIAKMYEDSIRKISKRLIRDGYRVIFMSFCAFEGDETAISRIIGGIEDKESVEVFRYKGDLKIALQMLASSDLIIASRFHAVVLGLVFGKKVLPMAYSDKTIDILNDIKFSGKVIDVRELGSFNIDNLDFSAIPVADIAEQKILAEAQFQELDKVLTRK